MNAWKHFRYTEDDAVATVTFDRPERLNSLTFDVYEDIRDLSRSLQSRSDEVRVALPRFKVESGFDLAETLEAMGMKRAFTGEADFSGMDGTHELLIGKAIHAAYVNVDEQGTEAAAATGIGMSPTAVPARMYTFNADHPFLFLIRDTKSGTILFSSLIQSPTGG